MFYFNLINISESLLSTDKDTQAKFKFKMSSSKYVVEIRLVIVKYSLRRTMEQNHATTELLQNITERSSNMLLNPLQNIKKRSSKYVTYTKY